MTKPNTPPAQPEHGHLASQDAARRVSVVEAMARAMCSAMGERLRHQAHWHELAEESQEEWRHQARAVLQALADNVTPGMRWAGASVLPQQIPFSMDAMCADVFCAMIAAAMTEEVHDIVDMRADRQ